jgi:hypothetical protein
MIFKENYNDVSIESCFDTSILTIIGHFILAKNKNFVEEKILYLWTMNLKLSRIFKYYKMLWCFNISKWFASITNSRYGGLGENEKYNLVFSNSSHDAISWSILDWKPLWYNSSGVSHIKEIKMSNLKKKSTYRCMIIVKIQVVCALYKTCTWCWMFRLLWTLCN